MSKAEKTLERIIRGYSDANIDFDELRRVLNKLGFDERIKGSHHIYSMTGVEEIVNIQPRDSMAKPYQVKQVRNIILKYKLRLNDE
jgi:predicted RNA binding protein YcfA (HicA-like mRNA interferase family)